MVSVLLTICEYLGYLSSAAESIQRIHQRVSFSRNDSKGIQKVFN